MVATKDKSRLLRRRSTQVALLIVVLVASYPLSFGPACWIVARINMSTNPVHGQLFAWVYQPVAGWIAHQRGGTRKFLDGWISLGFPNDVKLHKREDMDAIVWVTPTYGFTVFSTPRESIPSAADVPSSHTRD